MEQTTGQPVIHRKAFWHLASLHSLSPAVQSLGCRLVLSFQAGTFPIKKSSNAHKTYKAKGAPMHCSSNPCPASVNYKHPAFPVVQAQDVSPELAARLDSKCYINQLPAADSMPENRKYVPVQSRKVNDTPVGRPAFEFVVPKPPHINALQQALVKDECLKNELQDPDRSLAWYKTETGRRKEAEENDRPYTLPQLKPTLQNMRAFIAHLQGNQHFSEPLDACASQALAKVDSWAQELLDLGVPYKRTVILTLIFSTLYDLLVQQRILEPLEQQQPELTKDRLVMPSLVRFAFLLTQQQSQSPSVTSIKPETVVSCHWYGFNPEGPDEKDCLFSWETRLYMTEFLAELLDNKAVWLYPSWEELDVDDFCRFGHLPVYPLGLITTYAANADGAMHSPLRFMQHDVFHIFQTGSARYIEGAQPLDKPESRCAFRQLIIDRLPGALACWQLQEAIELLVFDLFHEENTKHANLMLEQNSFIPLMCVQAQARREHWCDYSRRYQGIADEQAAIASLWMHRLFTHWKTSNFHLTDTEIEAFAQKFTATELKQLQCHLTYIAQHRTALRELFLSDALERPMPNWGPPTDNRRFRCIKDQFLDPDLHNFFQLREPHGGGCVDHSDIVYFDRLHQDGGPEQMERATGHSIADRTAF